MGWISKRYWKNGHGLSKGNSRAGRRSAPLRKIVGTKFFKPEHAKIWEREHEYELLECGHLGKILSLIGTNGLFGTQPADSRRCIACDREGKR